MESRGRRRLCPILRPRGRRAIRRQSGALRGDDHSRAAAHHARAADPLSGAPPRYSVAPNPPRTRMHASLDMPQTHHPASRPGSAAGVGSAGSGLSSVCAIALLLGLCAINLACSHADRMKPTAEAFQRGAYAKAATTFEPLLEDRRESDKDRLLYEMEAGAIYAALGDGARSEAALAWADEDTWRYLDTEPDVRITEQAAAILTNQTVITYRGTTYDRIMVPTYRALNQLAAGDLEAAGVSLRRAYEWQRDAVEKHAKEIEALESKADAAAREKGYDAKRAMDDPSVKDGLASAYGGIRDMRGYADFAVPYATYLQAVQQMATGRRDAAAQATVGFRKVAGMLRESDRAYAEEDARLAEAASIGTGGTGGPDPTQGAVYVFVESGMGPELREFKISIPLFIRQVPYVGASFPVLEFRAGGPGGFTARAGGASYPSAQLTDMDAVVAGDFNRRLPAIIALTLVSSASKAVGTYFLQEAALERSRDAAWLVAIGGAIYQLATNSADLRIWLTLPKEVLYARLPAPRDGFVSLDLGDGQRIGPLAVESDGVSIVHVRLPSNGATPAVRTMRFPRGGAMQASAGRSPGEP